MTFVVALLLLLLLYFGGMNLDKALLSQNSTPEISLLDEPEEEEEEFIEPELLTELGDQETEEAVSAAPQLKGEPEKAPEENTQLVVPDKNPKPAPPIEKPITQKKESPVKSTTPSATDQERQKVTSSMANKFSGRNGSESGKANGSGSGGTGVGKSGNVSGRQFLGCPSPSVALRNKVTVVISITVDAEGNVTYAKARPGSGAEASVVAACERCARQAKWNKKEGAPDAKGSITFTITPKQN